MKSILDRLIQILCEERGEVAPQLDDRQKPLCFRALRNVRPPIPASEEFLRLQDEYLAGLNASRGVANACDLIYNDGIALWQGDITVLKADAIVNACNEKLLGCFVPLHNCIDNAIHSYAGVQLRLACNELMSGRDESVGTVEVTSAYNLPSKYVFHTVGPQIRGSVTQTDRRMLRSCYVACLSKAREMRLDTLAFCCISTGIYGFPKREAARIAVDAVHAEKGETRVIFCVFDGENKAIYEQLLKN